jgi:hypothetical protein
VWCGVNAVARWWRSHDSGGFDAVRRHNKDILVFVSARFPAVDLRWLSHIKECRLLKSVAGRNQCQPVSVLGRNHVSPSSVGR